MTQSYCAPQYGPVHWKIRSRSPVAPSSQRPLVSPFGVPFLTQGVRHLVSHGSSLRSGCFRPIFRVLRQTRLVESQAVVYEQVS